MPVVPKVSAPCSAGDVNQTLAFPRRPTFQIRPAP